MDVVRHPQTIYFLYIVEEAVFKFVPYYCLSVFVENFHYFQLSGLLLAYSRTILKHKIK
jgi:hypothetical protein